MTANPQRGEVEIILDKPYIVRLTTNAIARAEHLLDKSLINSDVRSFGFKEARALLFVGINDPTLTLEKIGDLMDKAEDSTVVGVVLSAWTKHILRHEKTEAPKKPVDPTK